MWMSKRLVRQTGKSQSRLGPLSTIVLAVNNSLENPSARDNGSKLQSASARDNGSKLQSRRAFCRLCLVNYRVGLRQAALGSSAKLFDP